MNYPNIPAPQWAVYINGHYYRAICAATQAKAAQQAIAMVGTTTATVTVDRIPF